MPRYVMKICMSASVFFHYQHISLLYSVLIRNYPPIVLRAALS